MARSLLLFYRVTGEDRKLTGHPDPGVQRIAGEIKAYLEANPRAAETLDGIVHWWLLRQRFEDAWEQVESALEYLGEQGLVAKRNGPTGKTVYFNAAGPPAPEREDS